MAAKKKTATKRSSTGSKPKPVKPEIMPIENTVKALLRAYDRGTFDKKKHVLEFDDFNGEVFVKVPTGAKDEGGDLVTGDYNLPETRDLFAMSVADFTNECCMALGLKYKHVG